MIITQVCNVLGRNEQVSSCFFEIKGYANRSIDGMEKHADDVRANLETALTDVLDVDVDVCATYGVGDDFPIIEHLISCNPKCKAVSVKILVTSFGVKFLDFKYIVGRL